MENQARKFFVMELLWALWVRGDRRAGKDSKRAQKDVPCLDTVESPPHHLVNDIEPVLSEEGVLFVTLVSCCCFGSEFHSLCSSGWPGTMFIAQTVEDL